MDRSSYPAGSREAIARVLVVDDEPAVVDVFRSLLDVSA